LPNLIDPHMDKPTSAIISIGNEILLGKTVNTNLAWLACRLAEIGIPVDYCVTIPDDSEAIHQALEYCWGRYDVVITTGGQGPTDDDITKAEIARFFDKDLVFHPDIWLHVQTLFSRRGMPTPEINQSQAMIPAGFTALPNNLGTAPGLYFCDSGRHFFALAGVPVEMQHVFNTQVSSILRQSFPGMNPVFQRTVHTFGISESALAEKFAGTEIPQGVSMAWLPQTGRVDMRFYGNDHATVMNFAAVAAEKVSEHVWGYDDETPAEVLGSLLRDMGLTLSSAESCSGGLVGKLMTDPAGASDYYLGSVVAYHNYIKTKVLNIPEAVISQYGAVSEECALAMARQIKRLTESLVSISITGVAGPTGGTNEKPVGTVWFGYSVLAEEWTLRSVFSGTRDSIRHKAAEYAILALAKKLMGSKV
jgi:nicotinamide-nucleotide amidase